MVAKRIPVPARRNVTPTQDAPIDVEMLDEDEVDRRLLIARWGLVPHWAKDIKIGSRSINARRESILDKPSFRRAAHQAPRPDPRGGILRVAEGREEDPELPLLREG
jgi:putative SOS response-associated peptidase YedK